jgi:hypothetical protein
MCVTSIINLIFVNSPVDIRINGQAKRSRSHDRRLSPLCRFDRQVCVRRPPRRQVRVHGRHWLGHWSHVSPILPLLLRTPYELFPSYIIYGPLANGVTTTVFESTPVYPTPSRYWQTVDKYKITQFYSAPTAIRLLRRLGSHHVEQHDLSSLRVLGSVGEPINPEAWNWYNEHVGRKQCAIVDTYWYVVALFGMLFRA